MTAAPTTEPKIDPSPPTMIIATKSTDRNTSKESGEVAYVKTHRLVYTVSDGKIVRYKLENLDEPEVAGTPAP